MNTIKLFLIIQIFSISNIVGQKDSISFITGDWYVQGYGNKSININDTITFCKEKIEIKTNSNFLKWSLKSNGDFEDYLYYYKIMSHGDTGNFVVSSNRLKWGVDKMLNEFIIAGNKRESTYKIFAISKSKFTLKKIK